jgi:hypothetical protein
MARTTIAGVTRQDARALACYLDLQPPRRLEGNDQG